MTNQIDLTAFGVEDFTFFLELVDQDKVVQIADALRNEVSELRKKEKRLKILDDYLEKKRDKNKVKQDEPLGYAKQEVHLRQLISGHDDEKQEDDEQVVSPPLALAEDLEEVDDVSDVNTATTLANSAYIDTVTETAKKKTRTPRGSVISRNDYIKQLVEDEDDWLYRTDFENLFKETEWVNADDNLREVVRQFLRQARAGEVVIERRAYTIAPNNKVTPVLLYGVPKFITPENKDHYQAKFEARVISLGLILTENEAYAKRTEIMHVGQIELETSK